MKELLAIHQAAVDMGLIPELPQVKTVEVDQIRVIPREVQVEKVSVRTLAKAHSRLSPSSSRSLLRRLR